MRLPLLLLAAFLSTSAAAQQHITSKIVGGQTSSTPAELRPFIGALTIHRAPFVDEYGRALDTFSPPDFLPVIVDAGNVAVVRGREYADVRPGHFPLTWSFDPGVPVDRDRALALVLYDPDSGTGTSEFVASTPYFTAAPYENGDPVTMVEIENQSGTLRASVFLLWK